LSKRACVEQIRPMIFSALFGRIFQRMRGADKWGRAPPSFPRRPGRAPGSFASPTPGSVVARLRRFSCSGAASPDRVALVSPGFIVLLVVVAIRAPLIVNCSASGAGRAEPEPDRLVRGSPLGPSLAHPFGVTSSPGRGLAVIYVR